MQSHRRQSAFTMVELLVAVLILSLIGLFVNQLFMHTQRAVSTGIRTGEILVESESIGDQIGRDASIMLPPRAPGVSAAPGGFLVIVNKRFDGARLRLGEPVRVYSTSVDPYWLEDELPQAVRSDQLLFFAGYPDGSNSLPSLTPQSQSTFGSDASAIYARITYGHVARSERDGSDGGNLGDAGYNFYANQWMLGRHQLLLHEDAVAASLDIYSRSTPPTYAAMTGATVEGYGAGRELHEGLTDVADIRLTTGDVVDPNRGVLETIDYTNLEATVYPYTFVARRLRANPAPQGLSAAQTAQTHSLLAQNVSDFIVDFAGDYDGIDGIDRDSSASGTDMHGRDYNYIGGNIKWYSHYPNDPSDPNPSDNYDSALPATYAVPTDLKTQGAGGASNIAYYREKYMGPNPIGPDEFDAPWNANADAIFVFRHDDNDPDNSKWPHLIRIRYRIHDAQGRIQSSEGGLGQLPPPPPGGHDQKQFWPERMQTPGRWFEHIIPVARPQQP